MPPGAAQDSNRCKSASVNLNRRPAIVALTLCQYNPIGLERIKDACCIFITMRRCDAAGALGSKTPRAPPISRTQAGETMRACRETVLKISDTAPGSIGDRYRGRNVNFGHENTGFAVKTNTKHSENKSKFNVIKAPRLTHGIIFSSFHLSA